MGNTPHVRILMLGSGDTKLLEPRAAANAWIQDRHVAYGNLLGRLCIVIKTNGRRWETCSLSERVTVYPTNSWNAFTGLWGLYRVARRVAQQECVNLIVTADVFGCSWVGYLLKRRLKVPLAVQMLGDFIDNPHWVQERWQHRLVNWMAKRILRRADAIRVHGEMVKSKLVEWFKIDPARIHVIPIPIQREPFLAVPARRERDEKVILWVGRFARQKDVPTLVRAARRVTERYPDATFRLVGSGPQELALRQFARTLGLDRQVQFLGHLPYDRIPQQLAQSDVFLLSSSYEDAPRVLVEASIAARPIVTTAVSGAGEVVEEGRTGFIVPIGDDAALADRLCYLFEHPERMREMGCAARQRAQGMWEYERILCQFSEWWAMAAGMTQPDSYKVHA